MIPFFNELFQYNNQVNQKIIAILPQHPKQVSGQCLALINHILNSHQIWNCKFLPGQIPFAPWELHALHELEAIDNTNYIQSLAIIRDQDLERPVAYTTRNGRSYTNNTRDILFQIINHSSYHRGQIASEFRRCGIEPLLTDYIFYKMVAQ